MTMQHHSKPNRKDKIQTTTWRTMQNATKLALLGLAVAVLVACGGGGGGKAGISASDQGSAGNSLETTSAEPSLVGYFRDSPVENLVYKSCNPSFATCYSGYTNANGAFKYNQNDTVQFLIGDLPLASPVIAKTLLTPSSITQSADEANRVAQVLMSVNTNGNANLGIFISNQTHSKMQNEVDKSPVATRSQNSLEALAIRLDVPLTTLVQVVEHLGSSQYLEKLSNANHPHARALLGKYPYREGYYNKSSLMTEPADRLRLKIWEESSFQLLDASVYKDNLEDIERRNEIALAVIDSIESAIDLVTFVGDPETFDNKALVGINLIKTNANAVAISLSLADTTAETIGAITNYDIGEQEGLKGAMAIFKGMSLDLGSAVADGKDALGLSFGDIGDDAVEVLSPLLDEVSQQLLDQASRGKGLFLKAGPKDVATAKLKAYLDVGRIGVAAVGAFQASWNLYSLGSRNIAFSYLDAYYRGAGNANWMETVGGIESAGHPSIAVNKIAAKEADADYENVSDVFLKGYKIFPRMYLDLKAGSIIKKYQDHIEARYLEFISEMGGLPKSDGKLQFNNPGAEFLCNGAQHTLGASFSVGNTNITPEQWTWQVPPTVTAEINKGSAKLSFPEPGIYVTQLSAKRFAAFGSPSHASKGYYVRQCVVPNQSVAGGGYQVKAQTSSSITYEIPEALRVHFSGWVTEAGATLSEDTTLTINYANWDAITPLKPLFVRATEGTVFGNIVLWFGGLWDQVKSVVVNFGDNVTQYINKATGQAITTISHTYSGVGPFTATVTYMSSADGQGAALETHQLLVSPNLGLAAPAITTIEDDRSGTAVAVPTNGSTADNTLVLRGTLAQSLAAGQAVHVYANRQGENFDDPLGSATVSGLSWSFTPGTALANGTYAFEVVIAQALDGTFLSGLSNAYTVQVNAQAIVPAIKLPHSGITDNQCHSAGSFFLMTCSGRANDLNAQQDGHRKSINFMSYSNVGSYSKEECVKDNVTGLIWEGKTANGTRSNSNTYTNYDTTGANQVWDGSTYLPPTPAQISASSNASGYVAAVNAMALCGYTDWRLPTADELHTIVDYSRAIPSINTTWFANTPGNVYWSSSPYVGKPHYAWAVGFNYGGFNGSSNNKGRNSNHHVRLVRATQ